MAEFTKEMLRSMREDIRAALATVETKHKIKFEQGNIRFDANSMTMKLEASHAGGLTKEEADYDRRKSMYHLPDRGTNVPLRNGNRGFQVATILGWSGRSVIVSMGNKRYKVDPNDILEASN